MPSCRDPTIIIEQKSVDVVPNELVSRYWGTAIVWSKCYVECVDSRLEIDCT